MRIGIVAGEASGDLLAAGLIAEIKSRYPEVNFEGIAGPTMVKAGCKAIYPSEKLAVMGLFEVLAHYRELKSIQSNLIQHFIDNPPDVFIGVDAPDFNLTVERCLKKTGIKTIHYVSPSVWAWRQYRVKKIARSIDLMLTLFPFEADFYRQHQVRVEYVGHPLADMIPMEPDMLAARQALGLEAECEIVALLPGSRLSEMSMLAEIMLKAAGLIAANRSGVHFVVPFATQTLKQKFEQIYKELGYELQITLIDGRSREVMAAANIVALASGTAALEAMLLKRPMVVIYRLSGLSYFVVKYLIKTPHISLPNILSGKEVAKELIQDMATPKNLAAELNRLFSDQQQVTVMMNEFYQIHKSLKQGANAKAANAVLKMLGK